MHSTPRLRPAPVLALCVVLGACAATRTRSGVEQVDELVSHGRYQEALELAADLAGRRPRDERVQAAHRQASVAFLLDRARELTFLDKDEEALVMVEQAREIDSESPQAAVWEGKVRGKLAHRWHDRGLEYHADGNLAAARECYARSMEYQPTPRARKDLASIVLQLDYRAGLSDDYYHEGLRAFRDYALPVARSRFSYAEKYRPDDERAERRMGQVDALLSRERVAFAHRLEEDGYFAAAKNEYRIALLLDPDLEEAEEGFERMSAEADADLYLDRSEMMVLRGELDRARDEIAAGREITRLQGERFDDLLEDIGDAQLRALYETALDLEHDYRFPEAIDAYERLLEQREWYEDARTRKATLEDYVQRAHELYLAAARTGKRDERIDYLRQIEVFWPEYRDVQERLRRLEATPPSD